MASGSGSDLGLELPPPRRYADGPPWLFRGRALYQLHLVEAVAARRVIPPQLHLVQAFGYTLGGFYLAKYDSSPAGVFDELVVLAGIVWNPPTSCAWAARVLVNSKEACDHGIEEVGLPSRMAEFSLKTSTAERKLWWNSLPKIGVSRKGRESASRINHAVEIVECNGSLRRPFCNIELLNNACGTSVLNSLQPIILQQLLHRVRDGQAPNEDVSSQLQRKDGAAARSSEVFLQIELPIHQMDIDVLSMLTGKPIVALAFENMTMHVDTPAVVVADPETKQWHGLLSKFPRFGAPAIPTAPT